MGLFSALAGVAGTAVQGIGSLIGAGFGIGQQVLTGIVNPLIGAVGQNIGAIGGIIPSLIGGFGGSSGGPGATVTGPVYGQPYQIPPFAGGPTPQQWPGPAGPAGYVPPGWIPAGPGGGVVPAVGVAGPTVMQQFGAEARELAAGSIASPWKTTCGGTSLAAQNHLQVNPATGAIRWFGPKGKPILWSDDLAACKRVKRVATRAGKVLRKSGGRY